MVNNCRWLYPRKDFSTTAAISDKGKAQAMVKRREWAPLRTNPSGIGSSNTFAALEMTKEMKIVKEIAPSSFSIPLQHVEDVVPQRTLPQATEPVLTLIHKDVHNVFLEGDTTRPPVASVPLFAQEKVQESH